MVLNPEENVKDLVEIPDNIKIKLDIQPIKWIDTALELALERKPQPVPEQPAATAAAAPVPAPATEAVKH